MKKNINDLERELILESIFIIGRVLSVEGRIVKIRVNKNKNRSHILYAGKTVKNVSVGSYVKIAKGFINIVGKVDGEYITEEKYFNRKYNKEEIKINRILQVSLFGHFDGTKFIQGIKEMPLIDNECYLLTREEFSTLHTFYKKDEKRITVGHLTEEPSQNIQLGVNELFANHIGIFGNTGSGKSNTLARMYTELFELYRDSENFKKNARFLLVDFNGEYSGKKCITDNKTVYNLSTKEKSGENDKQDRFPLSENDLINIELISILADATDKTQKPFISRSINFYNKVHNSDNPLDYFKNTLKNRIKDILQMSDKNKAYILADYVIVILPKQVLDNENEGNLLDDIDWHNQSQGFRVKGDNESFFDQHPEKILNTKLYKQVDEYNFPDDAISKLIHFLYLQLIYDVYTDKAQNEHISPAINKLRSKKNDIEKVLDTQGCVSDLFKENNLIVVNLFDVNLEMKKTLPLLFAKKIYSEHKIKIKTNVAEEKKSLNIIIDEAHNILSYDSVRETESWKDYRLETFEEIIKEGRKFGVFLTIASQRPYDISATIISQLHNYFIHRLINDNDINAVEKAVSYLDKLSFQSIPILSVGSCFIAGLVSDIPVKVDIDLLDDLRRPKSGTLNLESAWKTNIKK